MLLLYITVFVNVLLGVLGQLMLKKGVLAVGEFHIKEAIPFFFAVLTNLWVLGGFVFYGVSVLLWLMLISRIPLSIAYPMLSMGYVLVVAISGLYFGETIGLLKMGGVALIVTGVVLIAL